MSLANNTPKEDRARQLEVKADIATGNGNPLFLDALKRLGTSVTEKDKETFLNPANWKNAFADKDVFTNARVANSPFHPKDYLRSLEPEARKAAFLQFIEYEYPQTYEAHSDWVKQINEKKPEELHGNEAMNSFLRLEDAMTNDENLDTADTKWEGTDQLNAATTKELTALYFEDGMLTRAALSDMRKALSGFSLAEIQVLLSEPENLHSACTAPGAGKLKRAVELGVLNDDHLAELADEHLKLMEDREYTIEETKLRQEPLKDAINARINEPFYEKMIDSFRGLPPFQKMAVLGVGGFLAYKYVRGMYNLAFGPNTNALKKVGAAAMFIPLMYPLGLRKIMKGVPVVDYAFNKGEDFFSSLSASANEATLGKPRLREADIRAFSKFFDEKLDKSVGAEMEAYSALSQIPLGAIAESFRMDPDAMYGRFDFRKNSPLQKAVTEEYGGLKLDKKVMNLLKDHEVPLSEGLIGVYYLMGASEDPETYRFIEQGRGGDMYNNIQDPVLREKYQSLVKRGEELAKTTYKVFNWVETVRTIGGIPDVEKDTDTGSSYGLDDLKNDGIAILDNSIKFVKEKGKYIAEVTREGTKKVLRFEAETSEALRLKLETEVVKFQGVPEAEAEAFRDKKAELRQRNLYAQVKDGKVQIGLIPDTYQSTFNALISSPSLISPAAIGGKDWRTNPSFISPFATLDLFAPVEKTIGEFLNNANSADALFEEWKAAALPLKKNELNAIPAGAPAGLNIDIRYDPTGKFVEYAPVFANPDLVAKTPITEFMDSKTENIYKKYDVWKDLVNNGRNPDKDALKLK